MQTLFNRTEQLLKAAQTQLGISRNPSYEETLHIKVTSPQFGGCSILKCDLSALMYESFDNEAVLSAFRPFHLKKTG